MCYIVMKDVLVMSLLAPGFPAFMSIPDSCTYRATIWSFKLQYFATLDAVWGYGLRTEAKLYFFHGCSLGLADPTMFWQIARFPTINGIC